MYLKLFRSCYSNKISSLLATYWKVSEEDLLDEENSLWDIGFHIVKPLVMMYNKMEDLQELEVASGMPYSDPQIIALGIKLIKNMSDFEKGLNEWYNWSLVKFTWIDFKTHFTTAQENLLRVCGPTMCNRALNQQANAISTEKNCMRFNPNKIKKEHNIWIQYSNQRNTFYVILKCQHHH